MSSWEEVRVSLVAEHRKLREMAKTLVTLARAAAYGAAVPEFELRLQTLRTELLTHTRREIEALRRNPILHRLEDLTEVVTGHARQHDALLEAVTLASGHSDAARDRAQLVVTAMDDLIAHMESEEATFLRFQTPEPE